MEFKCDVCMKSFSRQYDLKRHKDSVHRNTSQFLCAKCQKSFNRKDNYVTHCRKCKIQCKYCDIECENQNALDIHVSAQHMDKKFMCSKCENKYSDKRKLKQHQQNCSQTVSSIYAYIFDIYLCHDIYHHRFVQKYKLHRTIIMYRKIIKSHSNRTLVNIKE